MTEQAKCPECGQESHGPSMCPEAQPPQAYYRCPTCATAEPRDRRVVNGKPCADSWHERYTSASSPRAHLPDRDYYCGSAYCDDPACNLHGAKDARLFEPPWEDEMNPRSAMPDANGWIKVSPETMPKAACRVLVWNAALYGCGDSETAEYDDGHFIDESGVHEDLTAVVTHWQPLPAPPAE
jgi:hypothetical protein